MEWLKTKNVVTELVGSPAIETVDTPEMFGTRIVPLKGRMTRLVLNDFRAWTTPEIRGICYEIIAEVSPGKLPKSLAVCRKKADGRTQEVPAAQGFEDLVRRINGFAMSQDLPDPVKKLMLSRLIFGEHEHSHGRLYSAMSTLPRAERELLMADIGYVENDISACAANILYLIQTGDFYHHDTHGRDIYSGILEEMVRNLGNRDTYDHRKYKVFGSVEPIVRQLRPVMKKLLTVASGQSCDTMAQAYKSVYVILMQAGIMENRRPVDKIIRAWKKEYLRTHGVPYRGKFLPPDVQAEVSRAIQGCHVERKKKWENYCRENGLPRTRLPESFRFTPVDFFEILRRHGYKQEFQPLGNFVFKGSYTITQGVETLANLRLHEWCIDNNIHIFTLHDAVFCRPENLGIVVEKREEFLREAATIKRKEMILVDRFASIADNLPEITETTTWEEFKAITDTQYMEEWNLSGFRCYSRYKAGKEEEAQLMKSARKALTAIFSYRNSCRGSHQEKVNRKTTFWESLDILPWFSEWSSSSFFLSYRITMGRIMEDLKYRWRDLAPYVPREG
jgi:hypothetical protein